MTILSILIVQTTDNISLSAKKLIKIWREYFMGIRTGAQYIKAMESRKPEVLVERRESDRFTEPPCVQAAN